MKVVPLTVTRANEVVGEWHRHNKPTQGGRFAIGAELDGKLVAVAIVGRPIARMVDATVTAEVTRLCVTPDAPKNACSFLYGAARRVWHTMGGKNLITYTLQSESGASLRAAGWQKVGEVKGAQWGRKSRARADQEVSAQAKFKWSTP